MTTLLTIGHSNHPIERFVALLETYGVTAVADMRSVPYSRAQPQFNRELLQSVLVRSRIGYVFLGEDLGIAAPDWRCRVDGRVDFTRVARSEAFLRGVQKVEAEMRRYRLTMMCSEGEPLQCHRSILLSRHLAATGVQVQHILPDGGMESQEQIVERMLQQLGLAEVDMFRTREQAIEDAYRICGERLPSNRPEVRESP